MVDVAMRVGLGLVVYGGLILVFAAAAHFGVFQFIAITITAIILGLWAYLIGSVILD